MLKKKLLPPAACMFLVMFSACAQTELFDDFQDGVVDPVYQFAVGDASSMVEGGPCEDWGECLQRKSNAYFLLPHIPGKPEWVSTPITPGVIVELDVLQVGVQSTVELGVVDSIENPQEFFALKVEIDPRTGDSKFMCYDETERIPVDGSLFFPMHLSFTVDETGAVHGSFADGISEIECPLHFTISGNTLAPAVVLWSYEEDGVAWVDNFRVELR